MSRVAVIGAGAWGTTLANLLAKKGNDVALWCYERDVVQAVNTQHCNTRYLPDVALDESVLATPDIDAAAQGAAWIVSVSPSQHVRSTLTKAVSAISPDAQVVSASKGIEMGTLVLMDGVLDGVLPGSIATRAAFLSGPSFAIEVAREQPTAVTVASRDPTAAAGAQALFQTSYFRVYTSDDVPGVELGGALKNVIALAAGMATGMGLGHNAVAALITRGLAEIARLGSALGARPITFAGLAGMGDLILTCTGALSRNRHVGVELGRGRTLSEILSEMDAVVEGVDTTRAAYDLACREQIAMPIVSEVHAVLFADRTATEAVENLMLREPKPELWQ